MRWIIGWVVLAACSGGSGSSSDDAGPGTRDGDALGIPLGTRISVSTITTPAGVMEGDSNWRVWGQQSLRVAPVFTVPLADGSTLVGYTTGGRATARVARLDAEDALVETYDLGAGELRGLAAEPDGHFAALLWDGEQTLRVTRYNADGSGARVTMLSDALAAPTDFNIGESRLEYGDGKYGACYHVHGISGFTRRSRRFSRTRTIRTGSSLAGPRSRARRAGTSSPSSPPRVRSGRGRSTSARRCSGASAMIRSARTPTVTSCGRGSRVRERRRSSSRGSAPAARRNARCADV